MEDNKIIVVVGGVAGGMSFATRYRRMNLEDHIIVLEKGPYVSFANCGLPYFISGEIEDRDDLLVVEQETLEQRFGLDIRTNQEVIGIDAERKLLKVKRENSEYELAYDSCVLSVGAKPIRLNIAGQEKRNDIFTLRNIPDADKIMAHLQNNEVKEALVIGAGFIGLEMAENLHQRGIKVRVVEKAPHVLPPFDEEMAAFAAIELKNQGVQVYTDNQVVEFGEKQVVLEDGTVFDADIVVMSIGVVADTDWLKESGVELGQRNGIVVDAYYRTSLKDVYAVGDAIIVKHYITQEDVMIPLASPANRQGRQLADCLSGIDHPNKGSLGTAIVRLFDLSCASTGLNERQLKGRDIHVMHLLANHHAGYFPGAEQIRLKLIFDQNTHQILGAQAIGKEGVDKRIDVLATAIKAGMKADELQELELAYAPPFGSAKDIINMAGYYAQNLILGTTQTKQWYEIDALRDVGVTLLDVRTVEEHAEGSIPGSMHIPLDELLCRFFTIPKDKPVLVYCRSAVRSYNAERKLRQMGYEVYNLDGSYALYQGIQEGKHV